MPDKTDKTFTFYFLGGEQSVGVGTSVSDAFLHAGYGGGAISALDFYAEGEHESYVWDLDTKRWVREESQEQQVQA